MRKGRVVEIDPDNPDGGGESAGAQVPSLPYVYVAAPYSLGDAFANVRAAIDIAEQLRSRGYRVFLPHLFAFWNFVHPHSWKEWMDMDLAWLARCDVVLRVPGESMGAEFEERFARHHGIPVVASIAELDAWAAAHRTEDVGGSSGNGHGNGEDGGSNGSLDLAACGGEV